MPRMAFVSKVILILTIVVLLGSAASLRRDYQDSWILEGLEIPFVLFVVTFALTYFLEKRELGLVTLAVVGRTIFMLIPNLKYVWFQGVYTDQQQQYALANYVVNQGHISTIGNPDYTSTPLLHLLLSIFSIVPGVPLAQALKYLPVVFSLIYPLLTYLIIKKLTFLERTPVLKLALFISSIPFTFEQFVIMGTSFGIFLAFLILFCLLTIFEKKDRRYWLITLLFLFDLVAGHSISSIIMMLLVSGVLIVQKIGFLKSKMSFNLSVALTFVSFCIAWLVFQAPATLNVVVRLIVNAIRGGQAPTTDVIPPTFFSLANANVFAAVETFLVYYGADIFLLCMSALGMVFLLAKRNRLNGVAKFLLLFGGLDFGLILVGVFLGLGPTRALTFQRLLFPIFSGISIYYLSKKKPWMRTIMFVLLISLSTVEFFACQPLVAPANIVYKELPASVPLGYVNQVNTIYQRQVAVFAISTAEGRIACDEHTRNLLIGLGGYNFSTVHLANYYPLDKSKPIQEYELFVIHMPGKSGTLGEQAKIRSPSLILDAVYDSSIVYTNGESYILANNNYQP
jgi:hypothetical protein